MHFLGSSKFVDACFGLCPILLGTANCSDCDVEELKLGELVPIKSLEEIEIHKEATNPSQTTQINEEPEAPSKHEVKDEEECEGVAKELKEEHSIP